MFRHVGLLESYFYGDADIEGSLAMFFRAGMDMDLAKPPAGLLKLRNAWHELRFINTTTEQVDWLRGEIARRGLNDRLRVVEADFRRIPGQFDKLVSIGVLEHAGRDQLLEVVKAHADALKPGGLGMLHFIGHVGVSDTEFYIRKHIFPGGWIPSLSLTLAAMEKCGLEVVDIENLRRHYAFTLDAWAERFDANWERIHALDPQRFDETFRRKWRTYLWSCAEMFRSVNSRTHLFQIVFSKGNINTCSYPMSRSFLYGTSD
jgi:cyclopropane-fatty-acyl-phospholipid synthase